MHVYACMWPVVDDSLDSGYPAQNMLSKLPPMEFGHLHACMHSHHSTFFGCNYRERPGVSCRKYLSDEYC